MKLHASNPINRHNPSSLLTQQPSPTVLLHQSSQCSNPLRWCPTEGLLGYRLLLWALIAEVNKKLVADSAIMMAARQCIRKADSRQAPCAQDATVSHGHFGQALTRCKCHALYARRCDVDLHARSYTFQIVANRAIPLNIHLAGHRERRKTSGRIGRPSRPRTVTHLVDIRCC